MRQGEVRGKSHMAYGVCLIICFGSLVHVPCFDLVGS